MNRKKRRISYLTGLLVLICEVYFLLVKADRTGMVFVFISILGSLVNTVRYNVVFDRTFHPKSEYEGWFPHYVQGYPNLNALAFNVWKWFLLSFSGVIFSSIGNFINKQ